MKFTEAREILREDADDHINSTIDEALEAGELRWERDPWVDGVVALLVPGTNTAAVVVYGNDGLDWEIGEAFYEIEERLRRK